MGNIAFLPIAPEVVLLAGAVLVLILEVTLNIGRRVWGGLAALSVIVAAGFSVVQWSRVDAVGPQLHFAAPASTLSNPMIVMDYFSAFAGIAIISVSGLALLAAWDLVAGLETRGAEFVALVLLAIAGLHTMAMSANLIMLFIGLETASIALYVVAGFTRERRSADEAAVKYFLLGSFASAILLYGIALVFAATGTTSIYGAGGMRTFFSGPYLLNNGVLLAGIGLMLVGLGFKVSAAPFHQWAPDVYQGAPTGAVGFMAAGVKVAGFAAIGRVLVGALPSQIDDWAMAIAALAALSVTIGTLLAIAQTDLKRMLAYSGVAHAGFLLTGVVAGLDGMPAMWFYVSTYAVQLVAAFTVISVVSGSKSGASPLDDYNGLSTRSPLLAASLAVMMLAMGGIPFTTGFVGKFSVFTVAINSGYLWLAITGLVSSVAGLFFYLRVVVRMYVEQPIRAAGPGTMGAEPAPGWTARTVLGISVGITLVLGIVPWPLLNWVRNALPL